MKDDEEKKRKLILVIFFLLGMASTISQSIIFREFLVIFYGNELVLGVILFFWLFAITVGAMVYTAISRRVKNFERLFLNLIFIFSILPFALIPFIRLSRGLSGTPYGHFVSFISMAWISAVAIFPPGFLVGLTFPLGCRILAEETAVARIYVSESAGSLTGGMIFSFVLIRFLSTPLIAALLMALFCSALLAYHIIIARSKRIAIVVVLLLSLVVPFIAPIVDKTTVLGRWKTLIKDMPLLSNIDSPYQNLALTSQMDQYSVFFNGVYGFSFPDEYGDAVSAHHILTQHPCPKDVLIIGEVTPGFIKESLKQPIDSLTVVYLDPEIYRMMEPVISKEDRQLMKNKKVHREVVDGRLFVKTTPRKFDIVYLNLPDPSTAFMNRFYTKEFFHEISRILKPGGVAGLNITSSENYLGAQKLNYNTTVYKTFKSVFPNISISPGTYTFFFGSLDPKAASDDHRELFKRFEKRKIEDTTFTPYLFETLYEDNRVKFKRDILEKQKKSRMNTDLSPVAYLYNLKLWDKYSSSRLSWVFAFIEEKGGAFWLVFFGVIIAVFVAGSLIIGPDNNKPAKLCSVFSVFTTGLTAMGLSIILILSYQNIYGYLFERIGFLISLFMLGLAIGGSSVKYLIKKQKADMPLFIGIQVLIVLLCLLIPTILRLLDKLPFSFQFLFFALMVLVGIQSGHIFPLAAHLMNRWGSELGKSAALVDGADHFGGCLGALLIGAFFIPLLGIVNCTRVLAALQGAALLLWAVQTALYRMGIFQRKMEEK